MLLAGGDRSLLAAVEALALSRATLRKVKQNLFWAAAYNACALPSPRASCSLQGA